MEDFGQAESGGVGGHEGGAVLEGRNGGEEAGGFFLGKDVGDFVLGTREGNEGGDFGLCPVAVQDKAEEKAEGADGLFQAGTGEPAVDQVELVLTDVVGPEGIGRGLEMAGEEGNAFDVGADGAGRISAAGEFIDQALAQG